MSAGRDLRLAAAAESNPLIALPQVDLGEVVLLHQLDEPANLFHVEDVARPEPELAMLISHGCIAAIVALRFSCR